MNIKEKTILNVSLRKYLLFIKNTNNHLEDKIWINKKLHIKAIKDCILRLKIGQDFEEKDFVILNNSLWGFCLAMEKTVDYAQSIIDKLHLKEKIKL